MSAVTEACQTPDKRKGRFLKELPGVGAFPIYRCKVCGRIHRYVGARYVHREPNYPEPDGYRYDGNQIRSTTRRGRGVTRSSSEHDNGGQDVESPDRDAAGSVPAGAMRHRGGDHPAPAPGVATPGRFLDYDRSAERRYESWLESIKDYGP